MCVTRFTVLSRMEFDILLREEYNRAGSIRMSEGEFIELSGQCTRRIGPE